MKRFNIFSGLLKAYEDDTGKKRLRTTASSTIKDLVGDEITSEAIHKMADAARGNLTIFLNHEYKVPEDALGSAEAAEVVDRGIDGNGNPVVDLDFDIAVNETNTRAVSTWEAINAGVKLGTSIGAIVKGAKKKKEGGLVIHDLQLLEASIVGIPANPRSWVQYAVKSLVVDEVADDEVVIEEYIEKVEALTTEPELTLSENEELAQTVEPDLVEGKTRVTVTVTTDEPNAQEASASGSAPGNADLLDETADGDTSALGDNVTRDAEEVLADGVESVANMAEVAETVGLKTADLTALADALKAAITKISDLEKQNSDLVQKNKDLEDNFFVAKEIVTRIANLPLGRKAHFWQATEDFRKRFPMYDDEFVRMLER